MRIGSEPQHAIRLLNELLRLLCRSLPAYLAEARPWAHCEDQRLHVSLERLAADQRRYAERVAHAITELGSRPNSGHFPKGYAAKNDLALEFLRAEVIQQQEKDIAMIQRCAAGLEATASLHALAEEILGNARAHLEILKEMANKEMTNVEIKMTKECRRPNDETPK
jgi:hypothetical protein